MTTLWYRRPAKVWTEALPIGNGRLGGMVFGGVGEERIGLNDDTLWSGQRTDTSNPGALRTLGEVRELLAKGDYAAADELSKRMMGPYTQSYLAMGDLTLAFRDADGPLSDTTDYRRSLDLTTGIARTEYTVRGTRYVRDVFCSNPDQCMVVTVRSEGPARFDVQIDLESPWKWDTGHNGKAGHSRDELILRGKAPSHVDPNYYRRGKIDRGKEGMDFAVLVRPVETDGEIFHCEGDLSVSNATRVTIVLTAATSFPEWYEAPSFDGQRAHEYVTATQLDLAVRKPSETLRQTHVADHGSLYGRVSFSLGTADEPRSTDELLAADDSQARTRLAELLFQYGRYLLIACSRPGDQPANLQGIWNAEERAPWSGNFTVNINTQMNYWPAGPANLLECQEPLLDLIKDLQSEGSQTAKVNYGALGWCAHHNVDFWKHSAPAGGWGAPPGDPVWAIWPMGGVWLCQHLWEHYLFGGDLERLRETSFRIMADACRFVLDFLIEGPDGRLTTSPSTSPEHRFIGPDGVPRALSVGSTCDLSLIHDLFTNTIEAAELLLATRDTSWDGHASLKDEPISLCALPGHDPHRSDSIGEAFVDRLRQTLARLAVPRVLPDGRVAEWSHDFPGEDEQHRHVSHLFALHPGRQWQHDQRMKAAARKSLQVRGNASTGWSLAWKINLWARLGDGEQAMACIDRLLTPVTEQGVSFAGGVYPNLFDAHPPFQIDGNFGFTSGVCEMLLQSHAGELHLLPALPAAWPDGEVRGLRARGGVTVDLSWRNGRLTTATLRADRDQSVQVRTSEKTAELPLLSGKDFAIDPALA